MIAYRKQPGYGSNVASAIGARRQYAGWRRIVVSFDKETFATLRKRALDEGTSFAEQVRALVKDGLPK
jgi:hypothetical protein